MLINPSLEAIKYEGELDISSVAKWVNLIINYYISAI